MGFAVARGAYIPRGRDLRAACLAGFLTLGIGNGGLGFAEVLIPSGIASLIVTIQPFWMVGWETLLPGGERLHAPTIGGMAVGLAGAALLFTPEPGTHFNPRPDRRLSRFSRWPGRGSGPSAHLPAPQAGRRTR